MTCFFIGNRTFSWPELLSRTRYANTGVVSEGEIFGASETSIFECESKLSEGQIEVRPKDITIREGIQIRLLDV